jgi:hypothetical protein
MTIKVETPEDLKRIIRTYDLTNSQIQNMTMHSLGYFASYEDVEDICNEIDEMIKNYPKGKRPIFGRYCLTD